MLTAFRFGHLGYLLSAVVLVLIGGALYLTVREVRDSTASVNHTLEVLRAVSAFNEAVSRAEAAHRGMLVEPADELRRDRDRFLDQAKASVNDLQSLTADNPAQQSRMVQLASVLGSRADAMQAEATQRRSARVDPALAAASRNGMELGDRLMQLTAQVREEELRLLEERQRLADARYRRSDLVLVLSIMVALMVLLPAYLGFRREAGARARVEAQLADLAESIPGAVFQYRVFPDGRSRYEFVSSHVEEVRGVTPAAALADPRAVLDTIHEDDRARVAQAMDQCAKERRPLEIDYRAILPSGERRWVHKSAHPRIEPDGSVLWNGHWTDVTEGRRLQEELVAARDAADAANRAKSTFLATMSHEIRTPMNGVLGMLELLSLTKLDADQRSTLNVIRQSGASLLRIIDDILDFSKIEAGKLELKPEPTAIGRLVERVRNVYSGNASSKGLLLKCSVDEALPAASLVDPVRLQQILGNLVSNAIKFTDHGEVDMQVKLERAGDAHDTISMTVRDTGVGISPEQQSRLFAPFTQAESSRRGTGTGLGLSISRRLAQMMGGALELRSTPGVGTTMRLELTLPRASAPEEPADDAAALAAPPAPRRETPSVAEAIADGTYVLIVDDHPINRMVLRRQVEALGYAAEIAADGVEALEKFSPTRFAMVITDCNMPEMDGYELARKIRVTEARDRSRPIPIIACTANAMGGEAEKCFAAGMNDYLSKPVELRRLAEKMDQWLPLPGAATAPSHGDAESAIAFDRSILDDACGGDGSMALEMLDAFARHHATDLARLTDAIHSGDYAAARKLAHRIKGSAATVGAPALARAAAALEHMQEGDGAGWKQGVARIVSERERFDRIARDALAGVAPGASV